jgi:RimJ/RimL family protein N-acetyltransferase
VPMSEQITDGTIVLRPRTHADIDAQLAGQDGEINRWLDWDPPTRENVTEMIDSAANARNSSKRLYDFAICDARTGDLIGNCLANCVDPLLNDHEVNIAYAVFPDWRGRGIASRTVDLLCAWISADALVTTAVLKINEQNIASIRVATRLGFAKDGTISTPTDLLDRYVRPLR